MHLHSQQQKVQMHVVIGFESAFKANSGVYSTTPSFSAFIMVISFHSFINRWVFQCKPSKFATIYRNQARWIEFFFFLFVFELNFLFLFSNAKQDCLLF